MDKNMATMNRRSFLGAGAVATIAALGALNLSSAQTALATTSAEKQAEADSVRSQLVSLQAELEVASDNYYGAIEEKEAAEASMEAEQAKIDEASARIDELQDKLSNRARNMYRSGSSSILDFLLGATSFEEFTQNWNLLTALNQNDSDMVSETKSMREQLQAAKDEYANQKAIAEQKEQEALEIRDDIQARCDQAETLISQLDAEAQQLLQEEQAAAAAAAAAAAQAAALAAAQEQSNNSGSGSSGSSDSGSGSSDSGSDYYEESSSSYSYGSDIPSQGSVVDYALSRIGCPYVWGAEGPDSFDCSGLVRWCYLQIGMDLPHQSGSLYEVAAERVPVSEARPGDVLWRSGHVGIAQGYGGEPYIHAPTFGAYVRNTDSLSWSGFTLALRFA